MFINDIQGYEWLEHAMGIAGIALAIALLILLVIGPLLFAYDRITDTTEDAFTVRINYDSPGNDRP